MYLLATGAKIRTFLGAPKQKYVIPQKHARIIIATEPLAVQTKI
jgi:hypothetical protein